MTGGRTHLDISWSSPRRSCLRMTILPLQENVPLKDLTTMKIGGNARYFCSVSTVEDLVEAVLFAREKATSLVILGGGSNILIANGEIEALVVKVEIKGIEWKESRQFSILNSQFSRNTDTLVVAGAGESWDGLVVEAVSRGLWGIENLSGIPGTVGATPVQNIGAYGVELEDVLEWVELFDSERGVVRTLSSEECQFGYRDSIFKHPEGKSFIITRVALRLKKEGMPNLEYKDLTQIFNFQFSIFNEAEREKKMKALTPQDIRKVVLEIRSKKFPDLNECGTAGSFFKNPIISKEKFDALKRKYPDLPGFPIQLNAKHPTPSVIKIPLAWILDNICGLKGFKKGNVSLFERQPIVLVQNGFASAKEVEIFAKKITDKVKADTDIDIEWEVRQLK